MTIYPSRICFRAVVVPSLTPGSYNGKEVIEVDVLVVVPSLTPGSYNKALKASSMLNVVVPSLTPGSYNV